MVWNPRPQRRILAAAADPCGAGRCRRPLKQLSATLVPEDLGKFGPNNPYQTLPPKHKKKIGNTHEILIDPKSHRAITNSCSAKHQSIQNHAPPAILPPPHPKSTLPLASSRTHNTKRGGLEGFPPHPHLHGRLSHPPPPHLPPFRGLAQRTLHRLWRARSIRCGEGRAHGRTKGALGAVAGGGRRRRGAEMMLSFLVTQTQEEGEEREGRKAKGGGQWLGLGSSLERERERYTPRRREKRI